MAVLENWRQAFEKCWKLFAYLTAIFAVPMGIYDERLSHLARPRVLGIQPWSFVSKQKHLLVSLFTLDHNLSGYDGKIHGGILLAMLDDCFARCAVLAIPGATLLTARLETDFRQPAKPGELFCVCSEVHKVDGRKVWVQGSLTMLGEKPTRVAQGNGLFITPRP